MQYFEEAARKIPVIAETDVLVAGGGTAGSVAAIAAARSGVKVMVVEAFGSLGGTATQGLVMPLMGISIPGNPMCSSVSDEMIRRTAEYSGVALDCDLARRFFDPAMLRCVLEDMAVEAGVALLYYTWIAGAIVRNGEICGIIVENKAGRGAIYAKRVIDATGDGDVSRLAGARDEKGNPETGKNQPISVRYIVSGVDTDAFQAYLRLRNQEPHKMHDLCDKPYLNGAVVNDTDWPLRDLFDKARANGELTREDQAYWQFFSVPGRDDAIAFNNPEFFEHVDGTNPADLTRAQVEARVAIRRQVAFYRKYLPGFERCYVSEIAPQVGIRESRRIECEYHLTDEDILLYRKFDDYVARSNYPVDVHGYQLLNKHFDLAGRDSVAYYEIPYRAMVVKGVQNLLVTGRCISAGFIAQSSIRVQPTVRALGEAAGIAAAMSVLKKIAPAALDGRLVQQEMRARGADFGDAQQQA